MNNGPNVRSPLLPRETIDAISSLTLEVRRVVEGLQGGGHRSLHLGASVEFAEHKKYYPGDDIRHLDWRVFARTDRFFVKQHEREVTLRAMLLLDCSPSMNYQGRKAGRTKFQFAALTLGALSHLLVRQGDEVGLKTFAETPLAFLPPSRRPDHLSAIISTLATTEPSATGGTNYNDALHAAAERTGGRAMFVLASDLWGTSPETELALIHLARRGHDVVVFRILDPDEIDCPFDAPSLFEGLEGERAVEVDPAMIRPLYQQELKRRTERWARLSTEAGIDFIPVRTDQAPERVLADLAARRHRVGGRR